MPLSGFPTATVSKSSDRTYPADDSRQKSSRHPQLDGQKTNRRHPQQSTPDVVSQPSARTHSPVTSNPSVSPRERLEEVEERIGRLEAELDRLRSKREVVVDCHGGPTGHKRSDRKLSTGKTGQSDKRSLQRRSRKPLQTRNDDRNLLPTKDRFEWLLPKRNENLLRKLFWP